MKARAALIGGEIKLRRLRAAIDRVDERIVRLLGERAEKVLSVGRAKAGSGAPIYRPERENAIHTRLQELNRRSAFPAEALGGIFREIISACRSLEAPVRIAYFGMEGSYSHLGALKQFGSAAAYQGLRTIPAVFKQVEGGQADYGVVPVENSTEGTVNPTLDAFLDSPLSIYCEFYLPIHHLLLSRERSLSRVREVLSHPQAIAQCRHWLDRHLPGVRVSETLSTSQAAHQAAGRPRSAAISSWYAAEKYGLNTLGRNLEDQGDNRTRFLVLSRDRLAVRSGRNRTSLLFTLRDEPGALSRILGLLASARINLSKIHSRPSKQRLYDYMFFLDVEGHAGEPRLARVLEQMRRRTVFFKLLGSYPALTP